MPETWNKIMNPMIESCSSLISTSIGLYAAIYQPDDYNSYIDKDEYRRLAEVASEYAVVQTMSYFFVQEAYHDGIIDDLAIINAHNSEPIIQKTIDQESSKVTIYPFDFYNISTNVLTKSAEFHEQFVNIETGEPFISSDKAKVFDTTYKLLNILYEHYQQDSDDLFANENLAMFRSAYSFLSNFENTKFPHLKMAYEGGMNILTAYFKENICPDYAEILPALNPEKVAHTVEWARMQPQAPVKIGCMPFDFSAN